MMKKRADELLKMVSGKDPVEGLRLLAGLYENQLVFTTSFGIEDQVITDMIFSNNINIELVTLDTGRLFKETYKVFSKTIQKYDKKILTYFPDTASVEKMVSQKGPYSFYESVDNRKECCHIRKVEPLNRALRGMKCWVTGIRSEQSAGRDKLKLIEIDETRGIYKYNPLLDWDLKDIEEYIKQNNVPYNILHDRGYVSIGCEPCTRAIKPGEDFRAGRWWWETNTGKECGLHEDD
ncbi:MAG: phosphoadenylyl-sulfate reductase [Bacteroidales bacterium]|jgi:phosphoadenosine phosphosulfate reductase|nr:phosphoadenylyl-sulfate reductase [Bacteroidales bacterium]